MDDMDVEMDYERSRRSMSSASMETDSSEGSEQSSDMPLPGIRRQKTHLASTAGATPLSSRFNDSMIKIEDDETSESTGTELRSLRQEDGHRDSPNSSMTSTSLVSPLPETDKSSTPKREIGDERTSDVPSAFQLPRNGTKFRARSSIPSRLQPTEYARQCVEAARASRLDPYALHQDEHRILQNNLCHLHVTVYLNIRNGILRLWVRNPNVSINLEEAIGCAKDERWSQLACFAYEWLVRRGYINFGCVEAPTSLRPSKRSSKGSVQEKIVVIGGGMAGLSCARQLTNAFQHYPNHATPKIVVLEGRNRIGGRIYSHPLTALRSNMLRPDQRPTAEMGAHIIVGFEHGNPLDAIVRGQLALEYHSLRDLSTLYDIDGTPVDENQDTMVERLYNDILDRSGQFRLKNMVKKTAEGDKDLIDSGRDPTEDDNLTIKDFEEATASGTIDFLLPHKSRRRGAGHRAAKANDPTEEVDTNMDTQTQLPAAQAATEIGFRVRDHTKMNESLRLDAMASIPDQSLGAVLDEGVHQYRKFLDLRPKAMRLLNWHYANLEYANATNVEKLSLGSWDQDVGNEFEGEHAQVVGGYQQVPRALWRYPDKLDVRTNKAVHSIRYATASKDGKAIVICEDGEVIKADKVVVSVPLGVLKAQSIHFEPPLPAQKKEAISRLGFGLLNKVVLLFNMPFWDVNRDMFGLLRSPRPGHGISQDDYRAKRGQFYLFWNCIQTSGLPVLIALMAGDAAHEAERTADREIVSQCVDQLRAIFGKNNVPTPLESIVTRWGSDRFARGTYSFVAAGAAARHYNDLAEPVANLFFAGEATCGTHPATVHGAYLSGLRAASEVLESIIGPIQLSRPLVPVAGKQKRTSLDITDAFVPSDTGAAQKRKGDPIIPAGTFTRPVKETETSETKALREAWDAAMWVRIYDDLGPPPMKPAKSGTNPFLLYQKDHWETVKNRLDEAKQKSSGKATAKAGRDEIRIELGRMWKGLTDDGKKPYTDETAKNKAEKDQQGSVWRIKAAEWDRKTWEVKAVWEKEGNTFEEFCERKRKDDLAMDRDSGTKVRV